MATDHWRHWRDDDDDDIDDDDDDDDDDGDDCGGDDVEALLDTVVMRHHYRTLPRPLRPIRPPYSLLTIQNCLNSQNIKYLYHTQYQYHIKYQYLSEFLISDTSENENQLPEY